MKKLIVLLLCFVITGVACGNLITNGGFEQGSTGQLSSIGGGWLDWGNSGWHHDDGPRIGSMGVKFWWDDSGIWQDFTAEEYKNYTFSVEVYNSSASPCGWDGLIRAEFYNSGNTEIFSTQLDRFYSGSDPYDQWVTIGGTVTAPDDTAYGRIILQIADRSDVDGDLYFDDASVVVPEPATIGLLGLGALSLLRRKKLVSVN